MWNHGLDAEASKASFEMIGHSLGPGQPERGHFPRRLSDTGLSPRDTFYGPWEYQVINGGQSCELANGDYGRYLFVVFWSPGNGWYIDT